MSTTPTITYNDSIHDLPTDKVEPSQNELRIVNSIFKKNKKMVNTLVGEFQDPIIIGILFILFSLEQVNGIVFKFVPSAQNSPYILIVIKALVFMVVYWVIKHFYLSRAN